MSSWMHKYWFRLLLVLWFVLQIQWVVGIWGDVKQHLVIGKLYGWVWLKNGDTVLYLITDAPYDARPGTLQRWNILGLRYEHKLRPQADIYDIRIRVWQPAALCSLIVFGIGLYRSTVRCRKTGQVRVS